MLCWITSPVRSGLRKPIQCHVVSTFLKSDQSAVTCHRHLLPGNWVFIRLPARGCCSVYLTQLSWKMEEPGLLLLQGTGVRLVQVPLQDKNPEIFQSNYRDFCIRRSVRNTSLSLNANEAVVKIGNMILRLFFRARGMKGYDNTPCNNKLPHGLDLTDIFKRLF